jgi:hypothetical protein
MNRPAETEKLRSWKATNDTTYPLGVRHGLVAGNPALDGGGERRKLSRLNKEELLAGNVGARPFRHRDGEVLGRLEAKAAAAWRMQKNSERRGQVREEEDGKAKSRTSARRAILKGADATPHLRRRARRVSGTFTHPRACPSKTTAHSHDASVPVENIPADTARGHDGTVTSVTSAKMTALKTAPTFTTTAITAPTKHPQATMATIMNKSL